MCKSPCRFNIVGCICQISNFCYSTRILKRPLPPGIVHEISLSHISVHYHHWDAKDRKILWFHCVFRNSLPNIIIRNLLNRDPSGLYVRPASLRPVNTSAETLGWIPVFYLANSLSNCNPHYSERIPALLQACASRALHNVWRIWQFTGRKFIFLQELLNFKCQISYNIRSSLTGFRSCT